MPKPAGERNCGASSAWGPVGFERLDELGLLAPLGGSLKRLRSLGDTTSDMRLGRGLRDRLDSCRSRMSCGGYAVLLRAELPPDLSPRGHPPLSPATEPWADEAARFAAGTRS